MANHTCTGFALSWTLLVDKNEFVHLATNMAAFYPWLMFCVCKCVAKTQWRPKSCCSSLFSAKTSHACVVSTSLEVCQRWIGSITASIVMCSAIAAGGAPFHIRFCPGQRIAFNLLLSAGCLFRSVYMVCFVSNEAIVKLSQPPVKPLMRYLRHTRGSIAGESDIEQVWSRLILGIKHSTSA